MHFLQSPPMSFFAVSSKCWLAFLHILQIHFKFIHGIYGITVIIISKSEISSFWSKSVRYLVTRWRENVDFTNRNPGLEETIGDISVCNKIIYHCLLSKQTPVYTLRTNKLKPFLPFPATLFCVVCCCLHFCPLITLWCIQI